MDPDDLPPQADNDDSGFTGELGRTVAGLIGLAAFLAIAGVALWAVTHWL